MQNGVYFVSGIDTDAGKSYVTGIIARDLLNLGKKVITVKFIQTGGVSSSGLSIDIELHRKIMGCGTLAEDLDGTTAPVIFSYPASPHLAAKIDGREIDFDAIEKSIDTLRKKYDIVLVEGAGGLHVPLKGFFTTIDYIAQSGYPLIFVTSGKLGSINHTLLSLEACRNRNIEVAMVAYTTYFSDDKIIAQDTFSYISDYTAKFHPETAFCCIEAV